jgi:hypothetical protein
MAQVELICMDTPHLSFEIPFTDLDHFLNYWESKYRRSKWEDAYDRHFAAPRNMQADRKSLEALFIWKNGGPIAKGKLISIRNNYFTDIG